MSQNSQTLEQKVDKILTIVTDISVDIDALALATGNGIKELHDKIDTVKLDLRSEMNSMKEDLGSKIDKVNNNTTGISARVEVLEDSMRVVRGKLGLT